MLQFERSGIFQIIIDTHATFHNRKFEPMGIAGVGHIFFIPQVNNKGPMLFTIFKQNGFCLYCASSVLAQIYAARPIEILLLRALAFATDKRTIAVVDI